MPIPFTCDACGASYEKGEEFAGKTVRCRCGATLQVPQVATLDYNDLQSAAGAPQPNAPIEVSPEHLAPTNMPTPAPQQSFGQQGGMQQQGGYGQGSPYQGQPQGGGFQQPSFQGQQPYQTPRKSGMSMDTLRLLILCIVGVLVVGGVAVYTLWPDGDSGEKAQLEPGALLAMWVEPGTVELPISQRIELSSLSEAFGMQVKNAFSLKYANSSIPPDQWHLQIHTPEGMALVEQAHRDFSIRLSDDRLTQEQINALNAAWRRFKSRGNDPLLNAQLAMTFDWGAGVPPPVQQPANGGNPVAQGSTPSQSSSSGPSYGVTAEDLFQRQMNNNRQPIAEFEGKVIRVTGVVAAVYDDSVELEAGGEYKRISCYVTEKHPWKEIVPGQQAKITGTYKTGNLLECTIQADGDNPLTELTARELAEEYAADKERTTNKYAEEFVYITGTVVSVGNSGERGSEFLVLETENDISVKCFLPMNAPLDWAKQAEVGGEVRFFARFGRAYDFHPDAVEIKNCHPMSGLPTW